MSKADLNHQEVARAAEFYAAGNSLRETGILIGKSTTKVFYALKALGVTRKAGGRPGKISEAKRIAIKKHPPWTEEMRREASARAKARGASHNWYVDGYVDGKGKERDTARRQEMDRLEYKLWREAVFKRDDFTCQVCGVRGGRLQADHVLAWRDHPHLRYEVSNGRTLCTECHKQTPDYGWKAHNRRAEVAAF